MEKNLLQLTLSSCLIHKERKTRKNFLSTIHQLIDWSKVEAYLKEHYSKGKSKEGRKSYPPLVLFKMLLLEQWYGLSDYEVEEQCKDSISFSEFIGIPLEERVPDHSIISRFRSELQKEGVLEGLLQLIGAEISKHGYELQCGKISVVDASITESARRPKGKGRIELENKEGSEDECVAAEGSERREAEEEKGCLDKGRQLLVLVGHTQAKESQNKKHEKREGGGVDREASWYKKGNKYGYGYKKHVCTNEEGLILSVKTTAANVSDSLMFEAVLSGVDLRGVKGVCADKGYDSEKNRNYLKRRGVKSRIMYRGFKSRAKEGSEWIKRYNKQVSKYRYVIERTFGGIKRWFKSGYCRYVGLVKTHVQHLLEAIAYNLYRMPYLIKDKVLQVREG